MEGSQRAVLVAVEGSASLQDLCAAHAAPRVALSRSRGAHGVGRAQERAVAARVRDVAVRGLLPYLLRSPGPRLFLLDLLTLGYGVDAEHLLPLQRIGCLVSCNHPALEAQWRSDDVPPGRRGQLCLP